MHKRGLRPAEFLGLLKSAGSKWVQDRAPRMGAALAFYTIFSMAPVLMIAIAMAGFVFGEEAARGEIASQVKGLVGPQGGEVIQAMLISANRPSSGIFTTIVGFIILIVGAMGVFGELQDSLNTIWGVELGSHHGILGMIRDRLLSFLMVLVIAFLLLVLLVISATLSALSNFWDATWPMHSINALVSFVVITGLFALIYKLLPEAKIAWRDVWLGATVTAILFVLGKYLIGLYLGQSTIGSAYGAAGSLAVLLIWLYYSAQIFLFGAELTQIYTSWHGSRIDAKNPATTPC